MNKSFLVALLVTVSVNTTAATKEEIGIELSQSLINSFVDVQLDTSCGKHINERGEITRDVNKECISRVNALHSALASEPRAEELVKRIDLFIKSNSIPTTN